MAGSTAFSALLYQTLVSVQCTETIGQITQNRQQSEDKHSHVHARLSLLTDCTHIVNRDHDSGAGTASTDFFHSQTVRQVVHPSSTQLLWYFHGHHTHCPQFLNLDGQKNIYSYAFTKALNLYYYLALLFFFIIPKFFHFSVL